MGKKSQLRTLCQHRIEINAKGKHPHTSPAVECVEEFCSRWNVAGGCGAKVIEMRDGTLIPQLIDDQVRYLPLEELIEARSVPR